ncbi:MAG: RluA family pseudouridine synthase [Vulcanimicrobiota bacterium]
MLDESPEGFDYEAQPYESSEILEVRVDEGYQGGRLDQFLAAQLDYSRSLIQDWIKDGRILVDERQVKASSKLKQGQSIIIEVPPLEPAEPVPDATIPLAVVYEDEHILVLNKQRGLVVHPGIGNPDGTLVNALLAHSNDWAGIRGVLKPGIVHRLDKNTSGLMVTAKHDQSCVGLQNQFRDRAVHKVYQALVWGVPHPRRGRINQPIARNPHDRIKMAVVAGGKTAISDFEVLEDLGEEHALVEVLLHTGRTHQIRVHLAWLGHPIVADTLYGRPRHNYELSGQALHCRRLGFAHPVGGQPLEFEAPLPSDFEQALNQMRG